MQKVITLDSQILNNLEKRLSWHKEIVDNHWLWTGYTTNGYGQMAFQGKPEFVHRIAAMLYLSYDLKSEKQVLHKLICRYRRCFNPEHLYIGTRSDNMQDAQRAGTRQLYGWAKKNKEKKNAKSDNVG